jgi:hypothetical protein
MTPAFNLSQDQTLHDIYTFWISVYRNLTCENIIWSRPRAAPFTTPKADRAGGAASFRQNRDACRSAGDRGGLLGFA